jgi:hypothetical protein
MYKLVLYESDSIEFGVILDAEQVGLPGSLYFLHLHDLRCVVSS